MIQVIKKEIEVTKEASEIFEALAGLVEDVKLGKPVSEIIAGNLTKVMSAVEGFEKLDEELKHEHFAMTSGVGLGQIAQALLLKKPEA